MRRHDHEAVAGTVLSRQVTRRRLIRDVGIASGLAAAGPALLAACSSPSSSKPKSSAKSIVVYSTTLQPIQAKLAAAFQKKTGIAVQSLRLTTSPLEQRFQTEQTSGHYVADILTCGDNVFLDTAAQKGWIANVSSLPSVKTLPSSWRPSSYYTLITIGPDSLAYNTNTVTGSSVPSQWTDVLRPEFKGQIYMPDPRQNDVILPWLVNLQKAFGNDFIVKLGQQKPTMVTATQDGVQQVVSGNGKLVVPCLAMNLVQYIGTSAPIKVISPPTPDDSVSFFSAIAAHAPNPDGARQWYEYTLSSEGQQILNDGVGISPLGLIPGSLKPPAQLSNPSLAAAIKEGPQLFSMLGLSA